MAASTKAWTSRQSALHPTVSVACVAGQGNRRQPDQVQPPSSGLTLPALPSQGRWSADAPGVGECRRPPSRVMKRAILRCSGSICSSFHRPRVFRGDRRRLGHRRGFGRPAPPTARLRGVQMPVVGEAVDAGTAHRRDGDTDWKGQWRRVKGSSSEYGAPLQISGQAPGFCLNSRQ